MAANNPKGWFRRKKGKLVYCWYNASGRERSTVVGAASMTNAQGWVEVGKLGLDTLVKKPDPAKAIFGDILDRYLATGKTRSGRDKAESTKAIDESNARLYLRPQWGKRIAKDIEPLEIQEWLDGLVLQDKNKMRSLMSAVYRHGQKFNLIPRNDESNPMKWVSCCTTTSYEALTLSPEEAFAIVEQLPLFERTLLILVAVTAIRIGEALGLRWGDVLWHKLQIMIRHDWVEGRLGEPKSKASKAPVEMHEALASILQTWRQMTPYSKDSDFVFASFKLHGRQPRLGSMIVQDYLRPAALEAGVLSKLEDGSWVDRYGNKVTRFGFHNFRHTLATFLIENGHNPLVVQRMLRHSRLEMTMHYTHNRNQRREAQAHFIERFLPEAERGPMRGPGTVQ